MLDFDTKKMLFVIETGSHDEKTLRKILSDHPEVRFVSFAGLDIAGNDTDERIPMKLFLEDMETILREGVQTDGSSVNLPKIAELNNARVDMKQDVDANWFIDYNFDNIDSTTGLPVGTLRIPAFLVHNEKHEVGSRVILKDAVKKFKQDLLTAIKEHPYVLKYVEGDLRPDDIDDIEITSATELEFWVRTPDNKADREELYTSQELKEQYWKRTYGPVRTALEKTIEILDCYKLGMEMGHKEVGGVKSKLTATGHHDHIMEQLEIDWKYAEPMQAADNESLVKYVVRDVFNQFGLITSFKAKPVEGVAGSGAHTHFGVRAVLKNGKRINLFNAPDFEKDYLSPIGFGALMGMLKNYEAMNPFISSTNDSLRRLKPGYEAPVCIATSIGHSATDPSRNRTILVGVVRSSQSPKATRFELRSPNPKSNTYLVLAAGLMAMLDGIKSSLEAEKTCKDLEKSISKKYGEEDFYLERDREYRSEKNVFTEYSEDERKKLFGEPPKTVWENLKAFDRFPEKVKAISADGVIDNVSLLSYRETVASIWATEFHSRLIPNAMDEVKNCIKLHGENPTDYDLDNWKKVEALKIEIGKSSIGQLSLLDRAREALDKGDYDLASDYQLEIQKKIELMIERYNIYKRNII